MSDTETIISVRPASPEGAAIGGELVYLSAPEIFSFAFGSEEARLKAILARAFHKSGHSLSYQYAHFAVVDAQVLGLVLGYGGAEQKKAGLRLVRAFVGVISIREISNAIRGAIECGRLKGRVPKDEFYINNLAVLATARGRGIGTQLLEWVENRARAQGFARCSLDVVIENTRARSLYERVGFKVIKTCTTRGTLQTGVSGMQRMVKAL